jgi:hypothetical protein
MQIQQTMKRFSIFLLFVIIALSTGCYTAEKKKLSAEINMLNERNQLQSVLAQKNEAEAKKQAKIAILQLEKLQNRVDSIKQLVEDCEQ